MRLRTELVEHAKGDSRPLVAGHYDASMDTLVNSLTHDAALAHALTQAIAEARNHCHGSWDTCDFIRERADELLKSWGYL